MNNIYDADDEVTVRRLVLKHQRKFAKHFLPKYVYGIHDVWVEWGKDSDHTVVVLGRVKIHYKCVKGRTVQHNVSWGKFNIWRQNIGLYEFIGNE